MEGRREKTGLCREGNAVMAGMQGADPSPPSLRPEGHLLGDGRRGWGLHQASVG